MGASQQARLAEIHAAVQARRWREARALLEAALAEQPDDLHLLDLAGFVCFFDGDYAATEGHCRRALALQPERAYAWKGLGLALARQHRLDDGTAALEHAIALMPQWFDPYWDLAVVQREAGRRDAALETLRRGAAQVPERAQDFQRLAAMIRGNAS